MERSRRISGAGLSKHRREEVRDQSKDHPASPPKTDGDGGVAEEDESGFGHEEQTGSGD